MTARTMLVPVALLALVSACAKAPADEADNADPVALVRTAIAQPAPQQAQGRATIAVYGVVEPGPSGEISLIAPAETVIAAILAPSGTSVAAGAPVLKLMPSRASAGDIARARADANAATTALARAQRLRAQGLASDADVETARATLQDADAAIQRLGIGPEGLILRAPKSGVVERLTSRVGDQVSAGTTLASLFTGQDLQVHFGIDPTQVSHISVGQTVELAAPRTTLAIERVDSLPDPATRQIALFARLPARFGLRPGHAVSGTIAAPGGQNAAPAAPANPSVRIPYAALLDDGGRSYVFVVAKGQAHHRDVVPGNSQGDTIDVTSGLAAGERLVIEGASALDDGMKVREP